AHPVEPQLTLWERSPPVLTEVQFFGPVEPSSEAAEPAAGGLEQPASTPFEDALREVDQEIDQAEELTDSSLARQPEAIEISAGPPPASARKVPAARDIPVLEERRPGPREAADATIGESAWFLEEEDLASDPSDPTRARRKRLLRKAMENLGALETGA